MKSEFSKRLNDFEVFDKIIIEVIPRYKQSGMSGDEWRQHVKVTLYFKGREVRSFGSRDMECASMMLGSYILDSTSPIPKEVLEIERKKCFQPSCQKDAVYIYNLKEEYSSSGEKLDKNEIYHSAYRLFCEDHKTRGDCGREDSDSNYNKITI